MNPYQCERCYRDLCETPVESLCPECLGGSRPNTGRSSAFFIADVFEAYDYVLDQASAYRDQSAFAEAVAEKLMVWAKDAQNLQSESL